MGHRNTAKVFDVWAHLEGDAHRLLLYMAHVSLDRHDPPVALIAPRHVAKLLHMPGRPDSPGNLARTARAMGALIDAGAVVRGRAAERLDLSAEFALTLDPETTAFADGLTYNDFGTLVSRWHVIPRAGRAAA